MNRRDFLKTLAALPGLAFLRPELPEPEPVETILPAWDTGEIYINFGLRKGDVKWNALGESWTYDGKEWVQDEFAPVYSGPDILFAHVLFAGGDFIASGSENGYIATDRTGEWVPINKKAET